MITKMSFFTGYSLEEHLNSSGKPFHTEKFNFRILILLENPSLNFLSKVHTKNSDINFFHIECAIMIFQLYQTNNETKQ